ncbi:hypothetical protein [Mycobacterium lepromatosis]|uniref:hypothetical protein n=1 Tax=Mycobacterium lepromatosis TaxID=480418 RepID=UPI000679ADA0|nr:hypothetical protein [Mycobacterium lepromatosis]
MTQQVDSADTNGLAAVPLEALDDLSWSTVVKVNSALRTSDIELTVAIDEFGNDRPEPFTKVVINTKATLFQSMHGVP